MNSAYLRRPSCCPVHSFQNLGPSERGEPDLHITLGKATRKRKQESLPTCSYLLLLTPPLEKPPLIRRSARE